MAIYDDIAAALASCGVPAFLNYWRKSAQYPTVPDLYCYYYRASEKVLEYADDEPLIKGTDFITTVYGKRRNTTAVATVTAALEAAGFEVVETEDEDEVGPGEYATHLYCRKLTYL